MGKRQPGPGAFPNDATGRKSQGFIRGLRCGGSYEDLFAPFLLTFHPRKQAVMPERP